MEAPDMTPVIKSAHERSSTPEAIILVPDTWYTCRIHPDSIWSFRRRKTKPNNIFECDVPLCTALSVVELSVNMKISASVPGWSL
jgi:hypothetical protein